MKVLLVNGSPHKEGCTYTALTVIEKELQAAGVETEIYWVGAQPISGCLGCG
ncbi:MAG: flavodoxin family protein, partial [Bacteroidales bacterium]|nr:flavodoxin family protein [Bacteroidales bacterium]